MKQVSKMNKRGISPIIATVIIVAITVAAGILLFSMIQPLIKSSIGQTKCAEVKFELDKFASCKEDGLVWVSIDRTIATNSEPDVVGWQVIVSSGEGNKETIDPEWTDLVAPGTQRTQPVTVTGEVKSVEVYPLIKTEKISEQCVNMKQSVTLSACA